MEETGGQGLTAMSYNRALVQQGENNIVPVLPFAGVDGVDQTGTPVGCVMAGARGRGDGWAPT